jgi:hypothetical protein
VGHGPVEHEVQVPRLWATGVGQLEGQGAVEQAHWLGAARDERGLTGGNRAVGGETRRVWIKVDEAP